MNARFVAYAATHGRTPDLQLAADRAAFPGGHMAGYLVWLSAQLRAWREQAARVGVMTLDDHRAFDAWLKASAT